MRQHLFKQQQGVTLLSVSIILLFICLLTSLFAVSSMAHHQQMIGNHYRENQSFEAAEGGMEYGIAYLNANANTVLQDTDSDGHINPTPNPLTSSNMASPLTTGNFSVQITNPTANNIDLIRITSTGTSQDGSVSKTITQLVHFTSIFNKFPEAPLTALNNISISGDVTISNPNGDATIVSGGSVVLDGSASTEAQGGVSSDSTTLNTDITQDAFPAETTKEEFFAQYFPAPVEVIKNSMEYLYSTDKSENYSSELDGKTGTGIWLEQLNGTTATINGPVTVGSPDKPVLLIVDGNFKLNGKMTLYGMMYVSGDWYNDGGGTATVYGAVAVAGNFDTKGTPDIIYTPGAEADLKALGPYYPVPGSWKDFS